MTKYKISNLPCYILSHHGSNIRQEMPTLREHLDCNPVFGWVRVSHHFSFLCCVCCLFLSSSCVLCAQCCQRLWIVHSSLLLRFSLTFMYQPLPRMKLTFHNSDVTLELADCVQTIYSVTIFLNTELLSLHKRIIYSFTIQILY